MKWNNPESIFSSSEYWRWKNLFDCFLFCSPCWPLLSLLSPRMMNIWHNKLYWPEPKSPTSNPKRMRAFCVLFNSSILLHRTVHRCNGVNYVCHNKMNHFIDAWSHLLFLITFNWYVSDSPKHGTMHLLLSEMFDRTDDGIMQTSSYFVNRINIGLPAFNHGIHALTLHLIRHLQFHTHTYTNCLLLFYSLISTIANNYLTFSFLANVDFDVFACNNAHAIM